MSNHNIALALPELGYAVQQGALTVDDAKAVIQRAAKHPGGRPKGVKNGGLDSIEQAVLALSLRRSLHMDDARRRFSESVVNMMLGDELVMLADGRVAHRDYLEEGVKSARWNWKSRSHRRAILALGVAKEELDVVVKYRRSEDRSGMGRLERVKGVKVKAGRGYGYKTEMEPIVERSLEGLEELVALWGQDVTQAVQEELGFEAVPRRQSGPGRRKLEPVKLTQEFTIGKRTLVGAGSGENGHALPSIEAGGKLSYAVEPTIAEAWQHEIRSAADKDPRESELYRQLDWVRRCPPLRPIRRWQSFSMASTLKSPQRPVEALPRTGSEVTPAASDDPWNWPEVQRALALSKWH